MKNQMGSGHRDNAKRVGNDQGVAIWSMGACVLAKSLQLCPTLCDYNLPSSSVHGIL